MNKVILYLCIGLLFLWGLLEGLKTVEVVMSNHNGFDTQFGLLILFEAIGLNLIAPVGIYLLYKKYVKDLEKVKEALA